jgi:hypothetical protein
LSRWRPDGAFAVLLVVIMIAYLATMLVILAIYIGQPNT